MHKSLLALPLIPLVALPLWMGDSTDLEPLQLTVQPVESPAPVAPVVLTGQAPDEELASDARLDPNLPAVASARSRGDESAPLELAREPLRLPAGLLLDLAAGDEEFAAHYAGLPIEDLVRQAHRIDQAVTAKLDAPPVEDPLLRSGLRELSLEIDTLEHERAWLDGALKTYIHAKDSGAPVPAALTFERFVERHRTKDMEDLHVLQVQVRRSHRLLHRRAIDALFDEGSYRVTRNPGPNF